MYIYIYIYVYIYINIYTYTYIYTYLHINICIYVYAYLKFCSQEFVPDSIDLWVQWANLKLVQSNAEDGMKFTYKALSLTKKLEVCGHGWAVWQWCWCV